MRISGFNMESFKFGVYIVAPLVAVYIFSVPEVFTGVITNRSYITYRPQAVIEDDDAVSATERTTLETTADDLDDATARRIEAYVRVGQEEQRRQISALRKRLQADAAQEEAASGPEGDEEDGGEDSASRA